VPSFPLDLPPEAGAFIARRRWRVEWWTPWTALVAPLAVTIGWWFAAHGMPWALTVTLAAAGLGHIGTALGFIAADPMGRGVLALGGLAALCGAAIPSSTGHPHLAQTIATLVSAAALAGWPAVAARRGPTAPTTLRPVVGITVSLVLVASVAGMGAELATHMTRLGPWERVSALGVATWPFIAVVGVLLARRRRRPAQ
jgi:hypothetical protein